MTYKELQTALKEFRSLGYELQVKLNANKDDLLDEYNRLVAEKEQQKVLMVASAAFDVVESEPEIKLNLVEMAEFLDRAIAYENSESVDPEEEKAIHDRAAELLAAMDKKEVVPTEPEIKVTSIPQPLAYLQEFFGDELPFTNDVTPSEPLFTLPSISAFEGIQPEELGNWWLSTPLSCDPCNYQSVSIPTPTPTPTPATQLNPVSVGALLIVALIQILQLVTTVALPLVIQSYVIGRKTFDAVVLALQSEQGLTFLNAS